MIRVLVILTIEGLITPLMGAVIYNAEPKTIVGLTANNTIAFDFDRNGVEDLRVEAVYLGFSTPVVQFLSPSTTQLLYEWSEPAMYGVDFLPYRSSQLIGPHSETTVVRFVSPDSGAGTRRLTKGFPLPDPREAERNFLNQTAYLGFRFQGGKVFIMGMRCSRTRLRGERLLWRRFGKVSRILRLWQERFRSLPRRSSCRWQVEAFSFGEDGLIDDTRGCSHSTSSTGGGPGG
jgi:hypothetical protein